MGLRATLAGIIGSGALVLGACAGEPAAQGGSSDGDAAWFESMTPEELGRGYGWSEGPAWAGAGFLLFSDVPGNVVYKWSPEGGVETFLDPSSLAGREIEGFREPGVNGLFPTPDGAILAADHGRRAIVRLDPQTKERTVLVEEYEGKRFNSPNDLTLASDGSVYFTDPPYGLDGLNDSPLKELDFNGVFLLRTDGSVELLEDELTFPNGVSLSPDERTLYVAVSDPRAATWYAYDRDEDGRISNRRVLYDATDRVAAGARGLPDGMCIAKTGEVFATGPGGLFVFAGEGSEPVVVDLGGAAANCAFGEDGRSLFVTAHNRLLKFRTRVVGEGF